jgi:hypothetical protein
MVDEMPGHSSHWSLGGQLSSAPAAVNHEGSTHVFGLDLNGSLIHRRSKGVTGNRGSCSAGHSRARLARCRRAVISSCSPVGSMRTCGSGGGSDRGANGSSSVEWWRHLRRRASPTIGCSCLPRKAMERCGASGRAWSRMDGGGTTGHAWARTRSPARQLLACWRTRSRLLFSVVTVRFAHCRGTPAATAPLGERGRSSTSRRQHHHSWSPPRRRDGWLSSTGAERSAYTAFRPATTGRSWLNHPRARPPRAASSGLRTTIRVSFCARLRIA